MLVLGGSCVTPKYGSNTGGTRLLIAVSDRSCVTDLDLRCKFVLGGGEDVLVPATYNSTLFMLECITPPARAEAQTVRVELVEERGLSLGAFNQMFFSYLPPSDPRTSQPRTTANICDDCSALNPDLCSADCAGVWGGDAWLDDCLVCSGGTTNHTANRFGDVLFVHRCSSSHMLSRYFFSFEQ
jgi:hypothetical protein